MGIPSRPWHFNRPQLAETYIETLKTGPQTIALFAERRKGKTDFLTFDMTPAAVEKGYRCVYVNFWEDKSNPAVCVINGIERSLRAEFNEKPRVARPRPLQPIARLPIALSLAR